ncbi:MAG: hypothetical protein BWY06_00146 [Candidatus Latescibacteria bacterium ADurb.Bin168]|nr:MAG: hypothetical protein BWY06_00146 [Candidatus Latescibacteria bacterium ADurb.Bin168]
MFQKHAARSALLLTLFLGCSVGPDTRYFLARPLSSRGLAWEIYTRGAWRVVELQGVRPPSYVGESVLAGGNYFFFAGKFIEPNTFEFRAWTVLPPVRRVVSPGSPPDTTGLPWLTGDDFAKNEDYQRYSLLAAAEQWPWRGNGIEKPDSLSFLFRR